jgi:hypothetical protein
MTGVSEPSPLARAQRHARSLRDAGDLNGARAALADTLDAAMPTYGEDHPEVLATAHLLAGMHRQAGEPAAARRVLEEALAAGQRRFGDSDPLLLAISFDLASVAEELGNRHEARRNFSRVASAGPAVLGQDHWAVRAARDYLGDTPPAPVAAEPPPPPPPARAPAPTPAPVTAPPAPLRQPQPRPVPRTVASAPVRQRGRGATVAASVAAVAAVAAAVIATVALVRGNDGPGDPGPHTTGTVSLTGRAPTDVRITQQGDALVLTWTDPAPGQVSFVVVGGPPGATLRLLGQLPAGTTRFPLNGLNATEGYCFRVAAIYSTQETGASSVVCVGGRTPITPG